MLKSGPVLTKSANDVDSAIKARVSTGDCRLVDHVRSMCRRGCQYSAYVAYKMYYVRNCLSTNNLQFTIENGW